MGVRKNGLLDCTVEPPLKATSLQRPLFCIPGTKNPYIFATATFFCLQGGRCREVQLYTDLSRLVTLLVRVMESSERHLSVEIEESPLNRRGLS